MFFILGTGRCGTLSMANTLMEQANCICLHEPEPSLIEEAPAYHYGRVDAAFVTDLLLRTRLPVLNGKTYGESNQTLALVVEPLAVAFPEAKYLWLMRSGLDVVASAVARGWYSGRGIGGRAPAECTSLQQRWIVHRIRGDLCGDVSADEWAGMSPFEKCCWYWGYVNRTIEQDLQAAVPQAQWRYMRLEDAAEHLDDVIPWLELQRTRRAAPAHHNGAKDYEPYRCASWNAAEWDAFERWCAPLMDRFYAGWRQHPTKVVTGPGDAAACLREGEACFARGDLPAAKALFDQALARDPNCVEALNNSAVCLWHMGDLGQALLQAAKGLELAPRHLELVLNGGRILESCERHSDARALYESYLAEVPAAAEVRERLRALNGSAAGAELAPDVTSLVVEGEACFERGELDAAAGLFEQVLAQNSNHVDALNGLAAVRCRREDLPGALDHLCRALEQDPRRPETVSNLATVLERLGDMETRELLLASCATIRPDAAAPPAQSAGAPVAPVELVRRGEDLVEAGELVAARAVFDRAREMAPDDLEVLNNLGVVNWRLGDSAAALRCFRHALERDAIYRPSLLNSVELLQSMGHRDDARALCQSVLEHAPGDREFEQLCARLETNSPAGARAG